MSTRQQVTLRRDVEASSSNFSGIREDRRYAAFYDFPRHAESLRSQPSLLIGLAQPWTAYRTPDLLTEYSLNAQITLLASRIVAPGLSKGQDPGQSRSLCGRS